ncbi:SusC/RagA family TonB-linked outer membrane protein [Segatella copri]|uniref:SusC/RagA family TonB-linked outer membrane protein n=1 Tax=Segatella copri TaxID=165179 RepID=UPI0012917D63|nr:TonB-dependent receptor [Segatella copri]MQM46697.1 TonB-dependent receptor [Segatella copri]MQM49624.1 TonB-dependent receptor [Segatella copri]MQM67627.1 TonB-dependent receptor [Segatella copri]MQM73937.1 TonB-dependent receptor [Segatella copri]MQM86074.1 TonB-dependent receptor [Segatella copri]
MMKQVKIKLPLRALTLASGLLLTVSSFAQTNAVKGHVKDASGEPIMGATITVNGKAVGITDMDGNFSVDAAPGAKITFTYLGMTPQTVKASSNMNITLEDDSKALNEVVVIGYGVAKKSDLTGSVTAIKPDSKNKGVVVNAQDMLTGKVAGVNITSNDGTPGGGAKIRVRGGSSLNASNDPLIVIDGLAMDNDGVKGLSNLLSVVNPQDIESFSVLKDASATAIYGSRGSNGVIIITTKKGRKGQKPTVSYSGSITISEKKNTIDVLNADEFRATVEKLYGKDSEAYSALGTANTNWQDLIYRTAISHDHNITVSGAAKSLPYRVSVGYTDQQGIVKTSDFKRATASLNLNPSFFQDHLTLNLNAKGMYARTLYTDGAVVSAAVRMDPTQDPYNFTSEYHKNQLRDKDGNSLLDQTLKNYGGYFQWSKKAEYGDNTWPFTYDSTTQMPNPLSLLDQGSQIAHSRSFIGSADIDYKVHGFEDLRLHATLGADISKGRQSQSFATSCTNALYYGSYGGEEILKRNLSLSAYAQYYKDFNKIHHFDIMAGYEWQHFWRSKNNDYVGYYPETNNDASLAGTERPHTPYSEKSESYLVSFFGRANYTLLDRYFLTATVRDDGSSRFKEHWAWFPSFAFAWKANEEAFLKNANWLSDLKLRLGYGKTGQQAGSIGDYEWIPSYSISTGTNGFYPVTGTGELYRPNNYRPDLKWETTSTYNVGLDWGIMDQRLSGSVDWYYRKTTDLLNYAPLSSMAGYKNQAWQNIGSLKNTGVEAAITWRAIQTKDWFWTMTYNFTYNKNEITDLNGVSENGAPVVNTNIKVGDGSGAYLQANQVGYAMNSYYVYQQVYDKNGKPIENCVVDRNGDGKINESDKYLYKSPAAPVTMGFSSRLEYKNWDFGFSLRASIGNYVYNNVEQSMSNMNTGEWFSNSLKYFSNRMKSTVERNWQTYEITSKLSDYYVKNASFLKCDNITLGYSFNNLFKSSGWHGLSGRAYATASNVFTITNYDGLDPEVGDGNDNNLYPRPFSVVVGLSLNF